MEIRHIPIQLPPYSRGFHLIDQHIRAAISEIQGDGLLHLFIKHTSAALTINENADPDVRMDLANSFDILAPENAAHYLHTAEGSDDMPAHIKAALIGSSVSIPIQHGKLMLGTWQGVYLCEFRDRARSRQLVATILTN